ncbi:MAG: alpha-L-arabinofuranosidase [Alphaproteobacteria bacterium]|nr:alpha-L-arabinofuranosidase [Alphaproteobacteria bacterium]
MKSLTSLGLGIVLWLVAACAPAQAPRELVVNGRFAFSGDSPTGWSIANEVRGKGKIVQSADMRRAGRAVLELAPNENNKPGPQPLGLGQLVPAAELRGLTLHASAWLGARDGATMVIGVAVLRKNGSVAASGNLRRTSTSTGALEPFETEIDVPAQSDIETIVIFAAVEGQQGRGFVDDLSLRTKTNVAASPTPPAPVAGRPAAAAIRARIEVDAARPGRAVPREIFGTNVEWIRDGNGLWNRAESGIDKRIIALTRTAGVSLIRFPGGAWSDYYFWRDGVGAPPASRPRKPLYPGDKEQSQHVFGTDEALAFARAVGGRLLITVNAGSGTPELAADWVRYVNGEGGKSPRVDRVEYWEIGNELYHKGDITGGSLPPERYAEKVLQFVAAMRAVDPTIKIGAIGLENFGRLQFNSYPDWNRIVLRAVADKIDFFAVHNGYAPIAAATEGADPADVYAAMLAYPILAGRNLETNARQIAEASPSHAGRIKLAVTEWGPLFAVDPKSRWIDHVKTLGSAVYVSSMMKTMLDSPQTDVANFFKLSEHGFMGWIGRRGGVPTANASLMAFELWSRHFGDRLVASRTESPTYDSKPIGWVDRATGIPYVEGSASLVGDGRRMRLIVNNKHLTQPAEVAIALKGFRAAGNAEIRLLSGEGPDSHVGTDMPRVPGLTWGRQANMPGGNGFDRGRPEAISVTTSTAAATADGIVVTLPPTSVAAIEFQRAP